MLLWHIINIMKYTVGGFDVELPLIGIKVKVIVPIAVTEIGSPGPKCIETGPCGAVIEVKQLGSPNTLAPAHESTKIVLLG
jgi:hypothetical protein